MKMANFWYEDTEEVEKKEEKSEFSREDIKNIEYQIWKDTDKTKNIIENNFKTFEDRLLSNNLLWWWNFWYWTFNWMWIYTQYKDELLSLKNNIYAKFWILNDWNNNEYQRIIYQEKYIEDAIWNLNEIRNRKLNSLEKSQNALKSLKEMRWFFEKIWDWIKTVWTLWINKIVNNWENRNAKKEIEKINKIEERLNKKLKEVQNKKQEIEWRFEKKMWKVDEIAENLWWILDNFWIEEKYKEEFEKALKEWFLKSSKWHIFLTREWIEFNKNNDWKLLILLKDINLKIRKNSSNFDKTILDKSFEKFNDYNKTKYKDFAKTKRQFEYFENNQDYFKTLDENKKQFEEFYENKKDVINFKDKDFKINWIKIEWNFTINKIWKWESKKIFFIKTNKDWDLDQKSEWWKNSIIIFDKEKWFKEVNEEFFKDLDKNKNTKEELREFKNNEELRSEISKKILEINILYKNEIKKFFNWKENKDWEKEVLLTSYNNFIKRFKFLNLDWTAINEANKRFEKNNKKEKNKESKNKYKDEINEYLKPLWLDDESLENIKKEVKIKYWKIIWNNLDYIPEKYRNAE